MKSKAPDIEPPDSKLTWHDVECGAYGADLELWEELAQDAVGPVLDLGCGSGRVALHLARRGFEVLGVDLAQPLVEALNRRAAQAGVPARGRVGDVRSLDLGRIFDLAIAPMQLIQVLPGRQGRLAGLRGIARHLEPGGRAAIALVDAGAVGQDPSPPVPDVREIGGWVYSSLPLEVRAVRDGTAVKRLRQIVSPAGELTEGLDEVTLSDLSATALEGEARRCGLVPLERVQVPPTREHVGSTVVILEPVGA